VGRWGAATWEDEVDFYSVWPMLALLVALWAAAATPLFRAADSAPIPSRSRVETLTVFAAFSRWRSSSPRRPLPQLHPGRPLAPAANRLYALLGPFGVALFFMITGLSVLVADPGQAGPAGLGEALYRPHLPHRTDLLGSRRRRDVDHPGPDRFSRSA